MAENVGKIYHTGHGNQDDSKSWTVPKWPSEEIMSHFKKINWGDAVNLQSDFPKINSKLHPYHCSTAPEEQMTDADLASKKPEKVADKYIRY